MIRHLFALAVLIAFPALAAEPVSFKKIQLTDQFLSEGAAFGDLNKDGSNDIVSGPFWWEGPDFRVKHRYGPGDAIDPQKYSEYFFSWIHDINKDSWPDVVVTGFPGADTSWFENPKGANADVWVRHKIIDVTDNESPSFIDVNGDRSPDLLCMNGGECGFLHPDTSAADKPWVMKGVTPDMKYQRFTHGLGAGDINGDGKLDVLESKGWWEQPADLNTNDTWVRHEADFGEAGAQMYGFDINGDGLNDVITVLHAHRYGLAWFEQVREQGKISFKKHLIMGSKPEENPQGLVISQMHAVAVADVNNDGLTDIITGKRWWAHGPTGDVAADRPAVLYWWALTRPAGKEPLFVPHLIDDNSGVGTQCTAGDVNGDKLVDVVIGNKKGTFVFLQQPSKTAKSE